MIVLILLVSDTADLSGQAQSDFDLRFRHRGKYYEGIKAEERDYSFSLVSVRVISPDLIDKLSQEVCLQYYLPDHKMATQIKVVGRNNVNQINQYLLETKYEEPIPDSSSFVFFSWPTIVLRQMRISDKRLVQNLKVDILSDLLVLVSSRKAIDGGSSEEDRPIFLPAVLYHSTLPKEASEIELVFRVFSRAKVTPSIYSEREQKTVIEYDLADIEPGYKVFSWKPEGVTEGVYQLRLAEGVGKKPFQYRFFFTNRVPTALHSEGRVDLTNSFNAVIDQTIAVVRRQEERLKIVTVEDNRGDRRGGMSSRNAYDLNEVIAAAEAGSRFFEARWDGPEGFGMMNYFMRHYPNGKALASFSVQGYRGKLIEPSEKRAFFDKTYKFLTKLKSPNKYSVNIIVDSSPQGAQVEIMAGAGRKRYADTKSLVDNIYRGLYQCTISKSGYHTKQTELNLVDTDQTYFSWELSKQK